MDIDNLKRGLSVARDAYDILTSDMDEKYSYLKHNGYTFINNDTGSEIPVSHLNNVYYDENDDCIIFRPDDFELITVVVLKSNASSCAYSGFRDSVEMRVCVPDYSEFVGHNAVVKGVEIISVESSVDSVEAKTMDNTCIRYNVAPSYTQLTVRMTRVKGDVGNDYIYNMLDYRWSDEIYVELYDTETNRRFSGNAVIARDINSLYPYINFYVRFV